MKIAKSFATIIIAVLTFVSCKNNTEEAPANVVNEETVLLKQK